MERFHGIYRRTEHRQPLGHVLDVEPAAKEILEPAK
jgi:hypothetical protein